MTALVICAIVLTGCFALITVAVVVATVAYLGFMAKVSNMVSQYIPLLENITRQTDPFSTTSLH